MVVSVQEYVQAQCVRCAVSPQPSLQSSVVATTAPPRPNADPNEDGKNKLRSVTSSLSPSLPPLCTTTADLVLC